MCHYTHIYYSQSTASLQLMVEEREKKNGRCETEKPERDAMTKLL